MAEEIDEVRVYKIPLVTPITVLAVIFIYAGYSLFYILGDNSIFESLIKISFEVFILCEIGLIFIHVYNKHLISVFLTEIPTIVSILDYDKLKLIIRTNMYSSLIAIVFLLIGSFTAVVTFINHGQIKSFVVGLLLTLTVKVAVDYNPHEQRLKQIKTTDKLLEVGLDNMLQCWMNKIFPNF